MYGFQISEKEILLEIPPVNECDISWITDINELEGVFCWIITSEGSATTETSDDSAEHTVYRLSVGFPIKTF